MYYHSKLNSQMFGCVTLSPTGCLHVVCDIVSILEYSIAEWKKVHLNLLNLITNIFIVEYELYLINHA